MAAEVFFIYVLVFISVVNGGILIWGPQKIQIPTLKLFADNDLKQLLKEINDPPLVAFKTNHFEVPNSIQKLFENKYTAYIPNTAMSTENLTVLTGDEAEDYKIITEAIHNAIHEYGSDKVVALIVEPNKRIRRDTDTTNSTEPSLEPVITPSYTPLTGAVYYSAKGKAIVYSSKPPLLKIDSTNVNLGNSSVVSLDDRESYMRLIVTILVEDKKVTLRFIFPWERGYWSLSKLEVEVVHTKSNSSMLSTNEEITAPKRFSYHCGGQTVFSNAENTIELTFYDVQVQPDVEEGRFNDAYNCIPFTTGPIWSGIFVTFILAVGLAIGLSALGSIKAMDKFDNQKTLSITVWD